MIKIQEIKAEDLNPAEFIAQKTKEISADKLVKRMIAEIPGVVSVTYNITPKPPSTMEAV